MCPIVFDRVLQVGAQGIVYLVTLKERERNGNRITSNQYAAKSVCSPALPDLLRKEFRILQCFKGCPNIVQCFELSSTTYKDGLRMFHILLEYAPRGDLIDLATHYGGKIPERDARHHVRMILKGLSDIHKKGCVHCDIKPENILVFSTQDGRCQLKITDFGLSKEPGEKEETTWECQSHATEYRFRGTPTYMSPESVLYGEIGPALDMWSLGCTVIEIVTGKSVWWRELSKEDLIKVLVSGKEMLITMPEDMSEAGHDFLRKCFVREPKHRWTADMLLEHPFVIQDCQM